MIFNTLSRSYDFVKQNKRTIIRYKIYIFLLLLLALAVGKVGENWDTDPLRGAVSVPQTAFGDNYNSVKYLSYTADEIAAHENKKNHPCQFVKQNAWTQGWCEEDSLWFYTTTQGSDLMPYDLFLALETKDSKQKFVAPENIDKFRYLPQSKTYFNPDALPVGFARNDYKGTAYVGFTCAACHTGQVNYRGQGIRIDGGPAMSDMVGFLTALQEALETTQKDTGKLKKYISDVKDLGINYSKNSSDEEIKNALDEWIKNIEFYNTINRPFTDDKLDQQVDYGYGRLDAFGRIYNRVLEHVINKEQLKIALRAAVDENGQPIFKNENVIDELLASIKGKHVTVIGDKQFVEIIEKLKRLPETAKPENFNRVLAKIFNAPSAPVSYPFLWDVPYSDYVQWNGLANNAGLGPLGRNTGEVIGVFATLDWKEDDSFWSKINLSSWLTGQTDKLHRIDFSSSINKVNLSRLESHLRSLQSPKWPETIFGNIQCNPKKIILNKEQEAQQAAECQDDTKANAKRGELVYNEHCAGCHQLVKRNDPDRLLTAFMQGVNNVKTDPVMASNSVRYSGYAGNFESIYQKTDVGSLVLQQRAPVVQVLTAVTTGAVAMPDRSDKFPLRAPFDWLYMVAKSFTENDVKESMKRGDYTPDTTSNPYASLVAYKARALNGIWATAPYLHNGSVPNLYSLLLPKKTADSVQSEARRLQTCTNDQEAYRPDTFITGSREFDPIKVGLVSEGYAGFTFDTQIKGNDNGGHNYATDKLCDKDRWDLIEFVKTL